MPDDLVQHNVPLARLSTLRVGGVARTLIVPRRAEQLVAFLEYSTRAGDRAEVLGRGSNTLIQDGTIETPVILMSRFSGKILVEPDTGVIQADAGATLPEIARRAADAGIAGLEYLAVIPGLLGGGVVMNCGIGGSGGPCIAKNLASVDSVDFSGAWARTAVSELTALYRQIVLPRDGIVIRAQLVGRPGHRSAEIHADITELKEGRKVRQPNTRRTSGSIWLPADGRPAGAIIEECGLRGHSIGRAKISPDHANWIVTSKGCEPDDVLNLVQSVEHRVYVQTQKTLMRELRILPQSAAAEE